MKLPNDTLLFVRIQSNRMQLEELGVFSDEMERILGEEKERLAASVNKIADGIADEEVKQIYIDDMADDWDRLSSSFPNLLRTSVFSRCVTDFEHMLLDLAKAHQRITVSKLGVSDLRDDGLRKANLYFTKVADLPFPADTDEWKLIMAASFVRNILVHNNGLAKEDQRARLKQEIKLLEPHVSCSAKWRLTISGEASRVVVNSAKKLLVEFQKRIRSMQRPAQMST